MAYIVLMPHSETNKTNRYQVVEFDDWFKFVYHNARRIPVAGSFDEFDEAENFKDEQNKEAE